MERPEVNKASKPGKFELVFYSGGTYFARTPVSGDAYGFEKTLFIRMYCMLGSDDCRERWKR